MITIGIFDSGVGGIGFAKTLNKAHPEYKIYITHDNKNMPYGNKTAPQIQNLTDRAIQSLLHTDIIIIACNTATAYAIDYLRKKYPSKLFVGFEPALKVAFNNSKTHKIAVLATPATLKSIRYKQLKRTYESKDFQIMEPNVASLAHQIENKSVDWPKLKALVESLANNQVDTLVLGCTHYHLIQNTLANFGRGNVNIIAPTDAVIGQVDRLLTADLN